MTKICTSLEQSKKLIELGINMITADMFWANDILVATSYITNNDNETLIPAYKDAIPAWSLSALLGLMPKLYEFENDPDDGGCQPNLCKGWDNNQWHIVYRSSIYITKWYDDPIDAAFEMVCWLKENEKI
ncbi:MAG: hypothetical protein J6S67_11485 [Methanobrevibacter sp.]|nr:hypothetical protein [Methanobrevibacter sp.]